MSEIVFNSFTLMCIFKHIYIFEKNKNFQNVTVYYNNLAVTLKIPMGHTPPVKMRQNLCFLKQIYFCYKYPSFLVCQTLLSERVEIENSLDKLVD